MFNAELRFGKQILKMSHLSKIDDVFLFSEKSMPSKLTSYAVPVVFGRIMPSEASTHTSTTDHLRGNTVSIHCTRL